MCVCDFIFPDTFYLKVCSFLPVTRLCVCKQFEHVGGFQSQKRMHWLSNPQAGEKFGPPDALCTNALLHVILFNMNKSLIYQKSVPQMCVPYVTGQKNMVSNLHGNNGGGSESDCCQDIDYFSPDWLLQLLTVNLMLDQGT